MHRGFRLKYVGPLADQIGWKRQRHIARQRNLTEFDSRGLNGGWQVPFQHRQQVLRLCQLLLQSGKTGLRRFQLTLQGEFGGIGPGARHRLDMGQPHLVPFSLDDFSRGADFRPISGNGNQCVGNICGQGQRCGPAGILLQIHLRS